MTLLTCSTAHDHDHNLDLKTSSARGSTSGHNTQSEQVLPDVVDFHETSGLNESYIGARVLSQPPPDSEADLYDIQSGNEVTNLDGAAMNFIGLPHISSVDDRRVHSLRRQPQPAVDDLAQAAFSGNPQSDGMGTAFQSYPNNWDYNMAMATPQDFQNQVYPMSFAPLPMQQPTFWDPTQVIQSQMMPTFGSIPLAMPHVQRTPCNWCMESFTRAADLQRHVESVHLGIKHHCFWPGCHNNRGKGYCRAEKLRTHQRQKHGSA